tara:strand:- start:84 stop:332 length:249 start_codon:yes stop_codon:yes gene_type:complete
MKLTCDQATLICDKSQYKEASFWEKIKLNLHVFLCKKCGLYSKQNSIMTTCYEKHKNNKTMYKDCLCEEEKKAMSKQLQEKI